MKSLLVLTDFSANAKNAANYGYQLAKRLKADVVLCNAVNIPALTTQAGFVVWPMDETELLSDESEAELKELKAMLQQNDHSDRFRPEVSFLDRTGTVTDALNYVINTEQIELVVVGAHESAGLNTFLLGNRTFNIINDLIKSILIVPLKATFKPIRKIAFALAFQNSESELEEIFKIIPLARKLNAEILITHIHSHKEESTKFRKWMDLNLTELSNKANYPNIFYRVVENDSIEEGLEWICEHGQVDMLAILHHQQGFFASLFHKSHTEQMIGQMNIPLLVVSN